MKPLPWRMRRAHLTATTPWAPLAGRWGLTPEAARLAWLRDAGEEELAWRLDPDLKRASDPYALPGVGQAVREIREALAKGERICVYGDYDVDGVTATALLVRVLEHLKARVDFFIPNRFNDGYGLNLDCIREVVASRGPALLISVDCGVRSAAEVKATAELGARWIITDHHARGPELPACTVVHPGLEGYANPHLSGVGVAFKLAQALLEGRESEAFLLGLLKLVALGTVADMVSLRGENALLVKLGLRALGGANGPGLAALLRTAKVETPLRARDIAFKVGPRLNAVGRMGGAEDAVRLLLTRDAAEAEALAAQVEALNQQRRRIQEDLAAALPPPGEEAFDLVVEPTAHKGVIGIVAGHRMRDANRPSAVCTVIDGIAHGSVRAPEGYDLGPILDQAAPFLLTYGGHRCAAGISFRLNHLAMVRRTFCTAAEAQARHRGQTALLVDGLGTGEAPGASELDRLEPFGQGFPEPVFRVEGELEGGFRSMKGVHKFRLKGQPTEFTAFGEAPPDLAGRFALAVCPQDSSRWPRSWRVEGELTLGELP